jgi:hypothetical protein
VHVLSLVGAHEVQALDKHEISPLNPTPSNLGRAQTDQSQPLTFMCSEGFVRH